MGNFLDQFNPQKQYDKLREEAKDLSDEQLEELHMNSSLPHLKILRAHKRYSEYLHVIYPDHFDIKVIPVEKFKHIPCLHYNPLRKRIIHCSRLKKRNPKDPVTFTDFVTLLAILNPEGKIDTKLKFAFRLYDFNEDGKICINDMKKYVKTVTRFDDKNVDESKESGVDNNKSNEKDDENASKNDESKNKDNKNSNNEDDKKKKTKEDKKKKTKKKKKKKKRDIEITSEEVINQVATKTLEEITGNVSTPIKLEDFAKVLLHSDFAGKYSLHLSLGSTIYDVFKKIMEKVDSTDHIDPIQDDEIGISKKKKDEEAKEAELAAAKEAELLKLQKEKEDAKLKSEESLSATTPKSAVSKHDGAYNDDDYEYDSQEEYDTSNDEYYDDEENEDPYGMNQYGSGK